jgi:hypothetical protein
MRLPQFPLIISRLSQLRQVIRWSYLLTLRQILQLGFLPVTLYQSQLLRYRVLDPRSPVMTAGQTRSSTVTVDNAALPI